MIDEIRQGESEIRGVFSRFRRRDFSGTEGQVIKNSSFQLAGTIVAKIGSIIFTILVARMLMPELFGLYSLALSTIVFFSTFSDLGIGSALITFLSKSLASKNLEKAKTYYHALLKCKLILVFLPALILLILSSFIANNYYNKPIFLALLVGVIYIPINGIMTFFNSALLSLNNFKACLIKEIIFQILKITSVPLVIYFFMKSTVSTPAFIAIIIGALSFCYLISLIYIYLIAKRNFSFLNKISKSKFNPEEIVQLKKFIIPLSFTALSGMFFGFIDTLMLGHYVDATNIGYYSAAFGLIGAAGTLISFMGGALLPIFSRLKNAPLERVFKRVRVINILIGLFAGVFTFFVAKYILLIYGSAYLPATLLLKIFAILLVIIPVTGLYEAYLMSREKTSILAWVLIISTLVNITLNYFFINIGLKTSMIYALLGACIATIISKIIYLFILVIFKIKNKKELNRE